MASTTLRRLTTIETNMADMLAAVARAAESVAALTEDVRDTSASVDRLSAELQASDLRTQATFERAARERQEELRAAEERTQATFERMARERQEELRAAEERGQSAEERAQAAEERTQAMFERMARERQEELRALHRELGAIADRQGRLVEDIVAPGVPRIAREVLGLAEDEPLDPVAERLTLRHPSDRSRRREFDVVAGHGGVVLVTEVKSTLTPESVKRFAASLPDAREYLVRVGAREVIGAVATLNVAHSLLVRAERLGLLVLAVGDHLLEVKNTRGFEPKRCGPR